MTTSSSFARLVAPVVLRTTGAGRVVTVVEGLPARAKLPGFTVKVIVPAVVPVEKTMLGWPLIDRVLAPAATLNDAMRLEVTTNSTAASSLTAAVEGVNESVKEPAAVTGDDAESPKVRVCC